MTREAERSLPDTGVRSSGDPAGRFFLELALEPASLPALAAFADELSQAAELDERSSNHLQLALEEVAMNLVMHGGTTAERFQVRATLDARQLMVEVLDTCEPFDFEQAASTFRGTPSLEDPPGGVGLFLVQKVMDEVRYEPGTPEGNRMTLVKRRQG